MNCQRVSLIVPTYKRENELVETLRSLLQLEYPAERWEILVVDQTPDHQPETSAFLQKLEKEQKIRWFHPPEIAFASLTQARNFGIKNANRPDVYLFVDDDVEVGPDFITQHLKGYEDEEVGATVGKVTVPGTIYPQGASPVGKISWMGNFIDNYHGAKETDSDNFIGCNHSLRADLLSELGLYDQEFIGNALREDSDMALRVRESGYKIRFLPKASVIHKQTVSGGTRSAARRQWYYALFYNNLLFYAKHAPRWRIPFFILHLWRPILAVWLFYGKGSPKAFLTPWQGIKGGLQAAARSRQAKLAITRQKAVNQLF